MYFMRCVKIYRRRTTFAPILARGDVGRAASQETDTGRDG
jgi:hypothetical protein